MVLLRDAAKHRTRLVPRGLQAESGAAAVEGGNHGRPDEDDALLEIDRENLVAIAEPGLTAVRSR